MLLRLSPSVGRGPGECHLQCIKWLNSSRHYVQDWAMASGDLMASATGSPGLKLLQRLGPGMG